MKICRSFQIVRLAFAILLGQAFIAILPAKEPESLKPSHRPESDTATRVDAALLRTFDKLPQLPALTDDQAFLRRVSLDLTGKLPTPVEMEAFVACRDLDKRAQQIDKLLSSEAYAT